MSSYNNFNVLHYLNESTSDLVQELSETLSKLTKHKFAVSYFFKHDDNDSQTEADYSSNNTCDCLVDCSGFVLSQASQLDKHYSDYFTSILDPDSTFPPANSIPYFGSGAPLAYAVSFLRNNAVDYVNLEAGGGSGFGWQLYCDNILLMTAGVGGGGSFSIDSSSGLISFGGGGGGGLQLIIPDNINDLIRQANTNSSYLNNLPYKRYSIGGGGGCGICDIDNDPRNVCNQLGDDETASRTINCGFKHDEDMNTDFISDLITTLQNGTLLSKCNKLEVYGGGGGGGGTDLCCSPAQVGYGFAFSFISSDDSIASTHQRAECDDTSISNVNDTVDGKQASGSVSRYTYDIMGSILDQASKTCPNSMSDWCCVCTHSQTLISDCLDEEEDGADDDCQRIKVNAIRVSWILEQDCCPSSSSANSNTNTTSLGNIFSTNDKTGLQWGKEQWKNYTIEPFADLPDYNMIINHRENSDESSWNDVNPYVNPKDLSETGKRGLLCFEDSLYSCQQRHSNNSSDSLFQHSKPSLNLNNSGNTIGLLLVLFSIIALGMFIRRLFIIQSAKNGNKSIAAGQQYLPVYGSCDHDNESIEFITIEETPC